MEKNMETTVLCWGCIGMMEKNMETTVLCWGCIGYNGKEHGNYCIIIGYILGFYRDNYGKENGNYCIIIGYILGLYRDNYGKENGDYCIIIGYIWGLYRDNYGKKMEIIDQTRVLGPVLKKRALRSGSFMLASKI